MTFNGLTDDQVERSRKKNGSNRIADDLNNYTLKRRLKDRFDRVSVKIYIIIVLIYAAYALILALTGYNTELEMLLKVLPVIPVLAVSMTVNCIAEVYYDRKTLKLKQKADEAICHVYRCGNTIKDVPAGDIVKGDYVLVQEGDIVPAEGVLVYGDIYAADGNSSRLLRNYTLAAADETSAAEYAVHRGEQISSGFAVLKITAVSSSSAEEEAPVSKGRTGGFVLAGILVAALTFIYILSCLIGGYGSSTMYLAGTFVIYLSMIVLASESLLRPVEFFKNAQSADMYRDGVKAADIKGRAQLIFIDKSAFVTDGKPYVTGFTDGEGNSSSQCYEIPYPLGTLLTRAIVDNTTALVNRDRIIGPDPYECAAVSFISERIKLTRELEIETRNLNGTEKPFACKKLIKAPPERLIPECGYYYDGAGNQKPLSNTAPLIAMADELSFQGSRVIAYAAEDYDGKRTFIGMLTIHEKLRKNAVTAYKALCESGSRIIMLTSSSSAEALSIADKSVTGASAQETIAFDKLSEMDNDDAKRMLPALKIITGEADKEYLLNLAKQLRYSVGITAAFHEEIEVCREADVVYASSNSGETVKEAADAVLSDGLMSLFKYGSYSRCIKNSAAVYTIVRYILLILSALLMTCESCYAFGFGMWYVSAALNILLSALTTVLLAGSGKVRKKNDRILDAIREKQS
ncbi:MAG: cation-transporting P-type ATPase [Oscillospiraceae bacterium]|nr:cation-transporting P-type ATPase [Oscillospiraceae bacterium]